MSSKGKKGLQKGHTLNSIRWAGKPDSAGTGAPVPTPRSPRARRFRRNWSLGSHRHDRGALEPATAAATAASDAAMATDASHATVRLPAPPAPPAGKLPPQLPTSRFCAPMRTACTHARTTSSRLRCGAGCRGDRQAAYYAEEPGAAQPEAAAEPATGRVPDARGIADAVATLGESTLVRYLDGALDNQCVVIVRFLASLESVREQLIADGHPLSATFLRLFGDYLEAWDLSGGTVCGRGYQVFVGSVFGPPNRPMVGYSQYPRYHSTPKAKATSRVLYQ